MNLRRISVYLAVVVVLLMLAAAGYFWATPGIIPPANPAAPDTVVAAASGPLDAWRDLVKQSAEARQSAASLQFHMDATDRTGSKEKPAINIRCVMDYKQQGSKFYVLAHVSSDHHFAQPIQLPNGSALSQDGADNSNMELGFDGTFARTRGSGGSMVYQTRKLENIQPPYPLPWNTLEFHPPKRLEELLDSGKFALATLQDLQEQDAHLRVVTFNYVPSGHLFYRVSYDATRGLLPVKAQEFAEDGSLTAEVHDVTIWQTAIGNKTVFLPIAGIVEIFTAGKSSGYKEFHVDPASIAVDKPLPEETFRLTVRAGEQLFDSDTSNTVADTKAPAANLP